MFSCHRYHNIDKEEENPMFCPVCKSEFKPSITVCPNCKANLVEELPEETFSLLKTANKRLVDRTVTYFEHLNIKTEITEHEEIDSIVYEIKVPVSKKRIAVDELSTIMKYEAEEALKEMTPEEYAELEEEARENAIKRSAPSGYTKANVRSAEYKSSGLTLIVFGILVTAYIVLGQLDIVPFPFVSYSKVIFLVLGVAMIGYGIYSLIRASGIKGDEAKEDDDESKVNTFLTKVFPKEEIEKIGSEDDSPEELKFIKRMDFVKEAVQKEFPDINANFIEQLVDDHFDKIYN